MQSRLLKPYLSNASLSSVTPKPGFQNTDSGRRLIKNEPGARQVLQGFVNCNWDGHGSTQGMHACEVMSLQGLLDILYIVWDTLREDCNGFLEVPRLVCIQAEM